MSICQGSAAGYVIFGGYDSNIDDSKLVIFDMNQHHLYAISVSNIKYAGKTVANGMTGLIDTRTPYLYLPKQIIRSMVSSLNDHYGANCTSLLCSAEHSIFTGAPIYGRPCGLPSLELFFSDGKNSLRMNLTDYLTPCSSTGLYCSWIRESPHDYAIIGSPILTKLIVIIDREVNQIG